MNISYLNYIFKRTKILYSLIALVYFFGYVVMLAFLRESNIYVIKSLVYVPVSVFIFIAYVLPILDYRYYFNKNSANVFFALPDRRANIFRTNLYFHLAMNILLFSINFLLGLLILRINGLDLNYLRLLAFLGYIILIFIGIYFLSAFITSKCTNIYDAIIINILYMLIPAIFIFTMYAAFNIKVVEWSSISYIGQVERLCKFYPQVAITGINNSYPDWYIPLIMALLGIVLHFFAIRENVRFMPEKIGDASRTLFGYRTLIPLILFAIFLITNWENGIICIFVLIITFLAYGIYTILYKKKFFNFNSLFTIVFLFFLANLLTLLL